MAEKELGWRLRRVAAEMREKDPRFRPDPADPCPCGSGKPVRRCCQQPDGTLYKSRSRFRPPGPPTGYSHPACYLNFSENCNEKITGEHWVSHGIFREMGNTINVRAAPWLKDGEARSIGRRSLTANILCERHNSSFSEVDATATKFFKLLNDINAGFTRKTLSRRKVFHLVSGEDLEIWAAKVLFGIYYSQAKDAILTEYEIDQPIFHRLIKTSQLPAGCGLYLVRPLGSTKTHNNNEINIVTIVNDVDKRIIGVAIEVVGLMFHFFLDPRYINVSYEMTHKLYRPLSLIFENKSRSHTIFLCWPPNPDRRGLVLRMNWAKGGRPSDLPSGE